MSGSKFRVAIIGGGIGGLTLAVALGKLADDIEVDIYESAAVFTEAGAGISMSNRIWETIEVLGLAEDMRAYAHTFDLPLHFRKADQLDPYELSETADRSFITFHRADFQTALCMNLPDSVRSHFSKRLLSYSKTEFGDINLRFKDDTTAKCDILIGCDGIRSAVRSSMYDVLANQLEASDKAEEAATLRSVVKPTWTGMLIYRSLISKQVFASKHPYHRVLTDNMVYLGKNQHAMCFPVGVGEKVLINLAAIVNDPRLGGTEYQGPWVAPAAKETLLKDFAHFEPEFRQIIESVDGAQLWALHVVQGLPTYAHGRVAIAGDAAHAMTPFQGAGGGMAIEDAYLLAILLAQPCVTLKTAHIALQVYDEIRRPFTQDVQRRSLESGLLIQLNEGEVKQYSTEDSRAGTIDIKLVERVAKMQHQSSDWVDKTSLTPDVEKAKQLVNERTAIYT